MPDIAPAPPAPSPAPTPSPGGPPKTDNPFAPLVEKTTPKTPPPDPKGKTPEPGAKTPPEPPKQVSKEPKELRAEYEKLKTERDGLTQKTTDLEAKIKDYEKRGKDTEALTKRLESLEKERDAAQAEIRGLKFEASPEYKSKYDEPFVQHVKIVKNRVEKLKVLQSPERKDEDGNVVQQAAYRPATWDDFIKIYHLGPDQQLDTAEAMFGKHAGWVIDQTTQLQTMEEGKNTALETERANWKKRSEEEAGKIAQGRENAEKAWQSVNADLGETNDDYHDDPSDTELVEARNDAFKIIDSQPQTYEQALVKNAHVRHMAAAFWPNKLKMARLQAKINELQAEMDKKNPKPPGKPKAPGGEPSGTPKEGEYWDDLRKAVDSAV